MLVHRTYEHDHVGTGMNGSLRAAREERGWSQPRLALQMRLIATAMGIHLPERDSLKSQISRWENGRAAPDDTNRRVLCAVFEMTEAELGISGTVGPAISDEVIEPWELADLLTRASISPTTLAEMERTVFGYAARYPSAPPAALLPAVRRQMQRLKQTIGQPQPLAVRRQCVALLGVLSGLAGNLALDLGDAEQAYGMFQVGRLAGKEAEDTNLTAWITATASIGPYFTGQAAEAAQLLAEADALAAPASSLRRRSWIAALHARALAAARRPAEARRALDQAHALMSRVTDPPTGTDFFDPARLDGITGSCFLLLRDSGRASDLLSQALATRAGADVKGRALLTLDLAACRAIDSDLDEAARLTGAALDIARGALVRPILDRAAAVRAGMAGWQGSRAVAELDVRLAAAAAR